jgi:hypothetical protein
MTQPGLPAQGTSADALALGLPNFGTVPLGPDEPELFTDAMERILDHLSTDEAPGRHR